MRRATIHFFSEVAGLGDVAWEWDLSRTVGIRSKLGRWGGTVSCDKGDRVRSGFEVEPQCFRLITLTGPRGLEASRSYVIRDHEISYT